MPLFHNADDDFTGLGWKCAGNDEFNGKGLPDPRK